VRPSPPLCGAVRRDRRQSCDTVPPTLVRLMRRALEIGRRNPQRGDRRLFHACPGLRRDVRPAGLVTSVVVGPCVAIPAITTPSRALHRHPRRCGSARRRDIATPTAVPRTTSPQRHPRISMRAATERASPTPPLSKPLLDGYRARHDVPPEARFARTAVYSTAMYAMPPHIDKTVRHACKLPPPWPIKGGAVPWPQGDDG
jgi:hypothetical protein